MSGTDPSLSASTTPSIVVENADPLIGLNLSGFIVNRLLAAGGMGLVYLAEHETIGRRAAVKVLKPEVAADAEWTRRFLTEARALASLKHRNLIEVLNFGKTPDGRQYLMMEFLEGEPLDAYIRRIGSVAPAAALSIADQVLNGLAEAHKKGVVHRDLKPSNVFLLREHNGEMLVKVIDFGLARQEPIALLTEGVVNSLPRSPDGSSLLAGTPEYIAPEQAQGHKVDGSADLYSLGIMLFEMLAGQLPFDSQSVPLLLQKHLSERPPRLSGFVSNLPEGIEEFVESLLEKSPERRPPSADAARVTCQRLLKRMSNDATAVRAFDPKQLPTMKVDRVTMPAAAVPSPELAPTTAVLPRAVKLDTEQSLERAFPKRRWVPILLALFLLLFVSGVAWWALSTHDETHITAVAPTPPHIDVPVAKPSEPAAAAPAPVDVKPVQPLPDPEVVKEVVKTSPAPALKVPPTATAKKTVVAVEKVSCQPDQKWKQDRSEDLREFLQLGARHPDTEFSKAVAAEEPVLKTYLSANSTSECVRVEAAVERLRVKASELEH